MKLINILTIIILISLSGCSSNSPFELSKQGPTVEQNYENHVTTGTQSRSLKNDNTILQTRPFDTDFNARPLSEYVNRRAPNPELFMYRYAHKSTRDGVVVPGYTVSFPMYKKVHYILMEDVNE